MSTYQTGRSYLHTKTHIYKNRTSKNRFSDVFIDTNGSYLNPHNLFMAYFNTIPNCITEIAIDCKKARVWFEDNFSAEIKETHYNKRYIKGSRQAEFDDIYHLIYEDLIVYFDTNQDDTYFLFKNTQIHKVNEIISEIKKIKKRRRNKYKPEISLMVNGSSGIDIKSFKVTQPKLSINDNYNDDFIDVHKTITNRLSKKNDKGLVILHGKPGTGKTSYIRYLITKIKKHVIFLPPNMAAAISNPNLISLLIDNPNSIFVIEDAENIVIDREHNGYSPVSALLNISDGLLSDCLNIQIICSFNTDISKVDSALMRKGRLIAKYNFKELEIQKANELSKKLGFSSSFESPMTLTEIYNQTERDFQQAKRRKSIGFNA
ncbi:MAG: AAA family ATPase [Bacteroidetes bacterium]|jgi:hypothetical protein|nr:AAA family ATPase [Bacteroidota bacterium]